MFFNKPRKPIAIFKGDDTNFDNNRKLFFEIESLDALNPEKIEFNFLGVKKLFDTIPTDGRFEVSFSREETVKFPLGTSFATLTAIDSDNRERTLDNRIAILVTNDIKLAYCGDDDKVVSIKIGTVNSNIVPPNEEAQTGEAADAKATYEALKDEVERAERNEAALDKRVKALEGSGYTFEDAVPDLSRYIVINPNTVSTFKTTHSDAGAYYYIDIDIYKVGDIPSEACLVVDCRDAIAPPVLYWGAGVCTFFPRTNETDFVCEAGKMNVYWMTQIPKMNVYGSDKISFVVAGYRVQGDGSGRS